MAALRHWSSFVDMAHPFNLSYPSISSHPLLVPTYTTSHLRYLLLSFPERFLSYPSTHLTHLPIYISAHFLSITPHHVVSIPIFPAHPCPPADSHSTFTGSLHTKRRADLVEIAEALGLETEAKMAELKESIQQYLDQNEADLSNKAQFKGLYGRRK